MLWHYALDNTPQGPVADEDIRALIDQGTITKETLLWTAGMAAWAPLSEVARQFPHIVPPATGSSWVPVADSPAEPTLSASTQPPDAAVGPATPQTATAEQPTLPHTAKCRQCGRIYSRDDMIAYGNDWICANCKPDFFQRLKEGLPVGGLLNYASFWARFAAVFIDGLLLFAAQMVVTLPLSFLGVRGSAFGFIAPVLTGLISYVAPVVYETYFIGRYGATLGKMALGIRVVRLDQGPVTYMRAFGRYFAKIVSGIICSIGYLMAAFDDQHRALHDHMCDTRVVIR